MVRSSRVLVIEHEADAPMALFGDWITGAGVGLEVVRPSEGDTVPAKVDGNGLVVLGGAMSADDDELAPWLPAVRGLLGEALADSVPTLGICLGAQLLAVAAGGRVKRGEAGPELGVCPLELRAAAASDVLFAPLRPPLVAAQWHTDAITALPATAVVLASNDRYDVQAFRLGENAWGVQFHPEVDRGVMAAWAAADHADLFSHQQLEQAVEEVGEAEPVLRSTWRPLAERFAGLVGDFR